MTTTSLSEFNSNTGFSREEWAASYRNVEVELTSELLSATSGSIPPELTGTLYRNGPGLLERDGHWLHNHFDGDGLITAFRFELGNLYLTNRFVRTNAFEKENLAGQFLYRGAFGSKKPGGALAYIFDLRRKNIANHNVVRLGDDLLALWEGGLPHALDPQTLQTKGLSLLRGALKPNEPFSSHPRFDPGHHGDRRLISFSLKPGSNSSLKLMEFSASSAHGEIEAGQLLHQRTDTFNGYAFLHDLAVTPNWAVFLKNNVHFTLMPYLLGQKGAAQCLQLSDDVQAHFWLIPRDSGKYAGAPPRVIDAPVGFVLHHLNAWEDGLDHLYVDSVFYEQSPILGPDEDFKDVDFDLRPEMRLMRNRINLTTETITSECLSSGRCEFPTVNPLYEGLHARFAWMAVAHRKNGGDPLQAIKKLDLQTGEEIFWSAAPHGFVGEPVMVPSLYERDEDAGWLLFLVWNGARLATDLVILRSDNLKEQACIELPLSLPYGLHGSWSPSA
jgi:all-trans-8'-apo-beta-carotenal 15,15'-oxygenase